MESRYKPVPAPIPLLQLASQQRLHLKQPLPQQTKQHHLLQETLALLNLLIHLKPMPLHPIMWRATIPNTRAGYQRMMTDCLTAQMYLVQPHLIQHKQEIPLVMALPLGNYDRPPIPQVLVMRTY